MAEYQEFPRMIYNHDTGETKIVITQDELEWFLPQGWSREHVRPEVVVSSEADNVQIETAPEPATEEHHDEHHEGE